MNNNEKNKKGNKKIIISIIAVLFIILILATSFTILISKDNQKQKGIKSLIMKEFKLQDTTVEYGTEINFQNEIQNAEFSKIDKNYNIVETIYENGITTKIYVGDTQITSYKFDKVGSVEFTEIGQVYYRNFLNQTKLIEMKKTSVYTVEDTKKPIIEGITDKTIYIGDAIDLKEGITAVDEIDGELEIRIEGEADTNTAGEYSIKVIAEDKNGNVTEEIYNVTVNNKPEINNSSTTKTTNTSGNKSNSSSNNKSNSSGNSGNGSNNSGSNSLSEPTTYNYETYGNKIYFEEDRGEDGNYSEKFTW